MTTESMLTQKDQEKSIQDTFEIIIDDEGMRVSWDEDINPEYNYLSTMGKGELEKTLIEILKDLLDEFTNGENVLTTETEKE
jgi:hypothetical protein